jgi:hypothetical protein
MRIPASIQSSQPADVTQPFQAVQIPPAFQPSQPAEAAPPFQSVRAYEPLPVAVQPQVPVQAPMYVQAPVAPANAKAGKSPVLMIVVILLVVLALGGGGAAYWFFLRPAPPVPMGVLEVNATPYAEVVSVTSDKGKAVPLPTGDHWTPLRLDGVPTGRYSVQLKGPDGSTQTQQCDVAESGHLCTVELKPIDDNEMDQIIGGAK